MQFLSDIGLAVGFYNLFFYLIAVIVIVFFHELGHFLVGRWCGVKVDAFSVGFGREIFGFNDSHGTRWKFCWIPLGGYVKFEGDANAASLPSVEANPSPYSLQGAKVWKRILIVAAGPIANFILAIAIFAGAYAYLGKSYLEAKVGTITEHSAAAEAGLLTGDIVRKIDGQAISSFEDIQNLMLFKHDAALTVTVERAGSLSDITLIPKMVERTDNFGGTLRVAQIGIGPDVTPGSIKHEPVGLLRAVGLGASDTWNITSVTLHFLGKVITGNQSANVLHGPVGSANVAGKVASLGVLPFIGFIGFVSVSIGLVNLFPIPMLDGGHLVFYLIEAIRGKPVSPATQEWSFRLGLSAILMLMIFVTANDVFWLVVKH